MIRCRTCKAKLEKCSYVEDDKPSFRGEAQKHWTYVNHVIEICMEFAHALAKDCYIEGMTHGYKHGQVSEPAPKAPPNGKTKEGK